MNSFKNIFLTSWVIYKMLKKALFNNSTGTFSKDVFSQGAVE